MSISGVAQQDAEKVAGLTRRTLARRDAHFPERRSRSAQRLNVEPEYLGRRKHWRRILGFVGVVEGKIDFYSVPDKSF
jgi:hypothetical protein